MVSFFIAIFVIEIRTTYTNMKQLLKIILAIIISYGLTTFITWDWNITTWEYYQRICMVIIAVVAWITITLVETADKSLNDESTRNDEILESYYKNKNNYGKKI